MLNKLTTKPKELGNQILLSDVGDVLIETNSRLEIQKKCIHKLFLTNNQYSNFSQNEVYKQFIPYKIMSQTTTSIKESIDMFFNQYSINAKYEDYVLLYRQYSTFLSPLKLIDGVSKTLEYLTNNNIPLILISDSVEKGAELAQNFHKLLMFEKNIKNPTLINLDGCIKGYYSSKDFGVKKTDKKFIELLEKQVPIADLQLAFVGHKLSELNVMAEYGMKIYYINDNNDPNIINFPKEWTKIKSFNDLTKINNIF
jgi:FMN phosphatase YigB (HAD superfamily)